MASSTRGTQHEIDLKIGRIRYNETGEGRPVVFVHGYLVDGELWREVAPRLAKSGHRCITPDLPLGSHEIPVGPAQTPTAPGVAQAVRELIERLDLTDLLLVGNDSGGAICQMLVTENSDRISGLVLTPCDMYRKFPPFPFNLIKGARYLGPLAGLVYRLASTRPMRWVGFAPLLGSAYDRELTAHWYAAGLRDRDVQTDGTRFICSADPDQLETASNAMAAIDLPTAFVWPRGCHFFKYPVAERMARTMKNAQLFPLERGETFVALEFPEDVTAAIESFEARLQPNAHEAAVK